MNIPTWWKLTVSILSIDFSKSFSVYNIWSAAILLQHKVDYDRSKTHTFHINNNTEHKLFWPTSVSGPRKSNLVGQFYHTFSMGESLIICNDVSVYNKYLVNFTYLLWALNFTLKFQPTWLWWNLRGAIGRWL